MPDPRFHPVDITADLSALAASERAALRPLVEAARIMDALFLRQVWVGNEALLQALARDGSPAGRERLHGFLLNKGPWSRLDHDAPLVPDVGPKPGGANFYPVGMTRDEVQRWLDGLPPDERTAALGFFTVVRKDRAGSLVSVPYSREYHQELTEAGRLLREAASLTTNGSLRRYLETRADAFSTDDYYESDVAWMELDADIEPVIGPYEVYEDGWFNAKAAFEAFVTIRDNAGTERLKTFSSVLQSLEDALPIDPAFRNPKVGSLVPVRVVNAIFTAGDANRGVQTAAFNLPNDERVLREKGSKSVLLKNVQEAKFRSVLVPIADRVLAQELRDAVSFEAFFTHILLHELMHGLGPHDIVVNGRPSTVRREMQDAYSAVEEAKADVSALWAMGQLVQQGHLPASLARSMYVTFLASIFRSLRFGINEAHGRGVAIQLNHFLDAGAVRPTAAGGFTLDPAKMAPAVESLTASIMTLQARADVEGARRLVERSGRLRPEVLASLDRLRDVPVDIEPHYASIEAVSIRGEDTGRPFVP
jgi:hypothetical protein